ncbi:tetratricopeptide repeat protein [Maritimibacter sp. DP07]|uniref:Tetratricopeptide repeat protein n=1 Tax=Maritimibacter harenae TaxID=2606218 RepID=A0A845LVB2_9RHOB|nr:tetratricopeptide repeat protein [Maritimibacter harenae]MZR11755.1 tetratricopeptide repeat protein [Maritimibacter harenae]
MIMILVALSSCDTARGLGNTGDNAYAPDALPAGEDSVDGLIVGHRLMEAGEYELALKAYLRAAAERGMTVDTLSAIGSANLRLGRLGQAERILRQATKEDPGFAPAWNNLGVVLMEIGQVGEAVRVFKVAFGADSGKTDSIRENLNRALAKQENLAYDGEAESAEFALMRRGRGDYLLLGSR